MNRISKIFALGAFAVAILALPSVASAQWYPNQGGYGGYNRDLRRVADRLVDRSKDFERRVDNSVDRRNDRGGWGGWGNNRGGYYDNDLKRLAGDFRRSAENFKKKYGNGRNLRNSEDAAARLLDSASRLDNALRNARMNNNLYGQWNSMRGDINAVANTYGYNRGNNRYPNRSGSRFPFPF